MKPELVEHLAFLIGKTQAGALSRDGVNKDLVFYEFNSDGSTKRDANNEKVIRLKTTTFNALRPSEETIEAAFDVAREKEVARIISTEVEPYRVQNGVN
jgi:hypothetical protein